MKNSFFYPILFCSTFLLMSNGGGGGAYEKEYVSFPMINSEIRNSMAEHETQKELRKEQTVNLGAEKANKKLWTKYKETQKKIQNRLRIVDFALQSIPTGYAMYLEAKEIKETQKQIIAELQDAPYALIVAVPAQVKFVDDLQMTTRLLMGIVVSYGAINQMEKAERQELLKYALQEVEAINYSAHRMLYEIIEFKRIINMKKATFKYYKDRDISIVKDVIKNVKNL